MMPGEESFCRRMKWENVLNAVLRSRRRRIDKSLESAARSRPLVTLINAVLKLDWNVSLSELLKLLKKLSKKAQSCFLGLTLLLLEILFISLFRGATLVRNLSIWDKKQNYGWGCAIKNIKNSFCQTACCAFCGHA